MSEQRATPSNFTTQPFLFGLFGDFTNMETLARFAKCSKTARSYIIPILERKKNNANEMRTLIPRLLPSLVNFPLDRDPAYYQTLLNTFFNPDPASTPLLAEVSYGVGLSFMGRICFVVEMTDNVMPAMRTQLGRRLILQATEDWRAVIMRRPQYAFRDTDLLRLTAFADSVRTDYAVVNDRITSVYERIHAPA